MSEGAVGRVVDDDLAIAHDDGAPGQATDDVELVLDHDDRHRREIAAKLDQQVRELMALGRVHARGRLVEQQQVGARSKRAGDVEPAAIGVGEAVGRAVAARPKPIAKEPHGLFGARARASSSARR